MSKNDKVVKVTPEIIKEMIQEERQRLNETLEMKASHPSDVSKNVKEVEASDFASSLSQCMDFYQACKLKESKMIEDLKRLQEVKRELRRRIIKGI